MVMSSHVVRMMILCALLTGVSSASFKWLNSDNKCGVEASSNLVHSNPWVVNLLYWRGETEFEMRCAATLIDSRHIITAAHCVQKHRFSRVVACLGEYDLDSAVDCVRGVCNDPVVRIQVADIIVHPGYQQKRKDHDIAILKLEDDAPFTDFIRPICLPSGDLQEDTLFIASGWGMIPNKGINSHLKKIIPLPYWTREKCQTAYNKIPEHVICAGGEEGIDTCNGDSGGPLTRVKDTVELWGVTSCGNVYCGTKDSPGFYTSVAFYMDWIRTVVEA